MTLTRSEAVYLRSTFHSLIAQADANPGSIGHLGYRAYVAEMLEALEAHPGSLAFTKQQLAATMLALDPVTFDDVREEDPLSELLPVIADDIKVKILQALETDPPEGWHA